MKLVIIESPLGNRPDGTRCSPEEFERNVQYARACVKDSLLRGEAPFASHVIYPLVLDDATPEQRRMGMEAGFAWGDAARQVDADFFGPSALRAVYTDRGVTPGMTEGIQRNGMTVEYRTLGGDWAE